MIEDTFYVERERLKELKVYIKTHLASATYLQNPRWTGSEYEVRLALDVDDANKLNKLFEEWHGIDNSTPVVEETQEDKIKMKNNIFNYFLNLLKSK